MTFMMPVCIALILSGVFRAISSGDLLGGVSSWIIAVVVYLLGRLFSDDHDAPDALGPQRARAESTDASGVHQIGHRGLVLLGSSLLRLSFPGVIWFLIQEVIPLRGGWLIAMSCLILVAPVIFLMHLGLLAEIETLKIRRFGPVMLVSNMVPPSFHLEPLLHGSLILKTLPLRVRRVVRRVLGKGDIMIEGSGAISDEQI